MSWSIDLDPCTRITTGAVGEPGDRTFYIQGRDASRLVTLLVEKQQVAALSQLVEQLLEGIEGGEEEQEGAEAPELEEPLSPEFRVGGMSLDYEEDRDLVVLACEEFRPEGEEADDVIGPEPAVVRFWATRAQMDALGRKGEEAVAGGRPICSMCGGPIDPDGHFCPSSNGHKDADELA